MNKIKNVSFFLLLFCVYQVKFIYADNSSIGDECKLDNNKSGTCMLLKDCSSALNEIKKGVRPKICSFQQQEPIVCCQGELEVTVPSKTKPNSSPERISRRKCREYSQSVYELVDIPIIQNNMDSIKLNVSKCKIFVHELIIGGTTANPGKFPHMALMAYEENKETNWFCSGALISNQFILTTAVCFQTRSGISPKKVRLGTTRIKSNTDDEKYKDVNISEIIVHPDFKYPKIYNNIALIKLVHPIEFNEYIRPACLPDLNQKQNDRFYLSGWDEQFMDVLNNYVVEKESNERCNDKYKQLKRQIPNGINATTNICTKYYRDACLMLNGSPIQTYDTEIYCMYNLQGLLSVGSNCASDNPNIYTKIAPYIDWIEKIVWP